MAEDKAARDKLEPESLRLQLIEKKLAEIEEQRKKTEALKRAAWVEEQRKIAAARPAFLEDDSEEQLEWIPSYLVLDFDDIKVSVVRKIGSGGQGHAYLVKGYDLSNPEKQHVVKQVLY